MKTISEKVVSQDTVETQNQNASHGKAETHVTNASHVSLETHTKIASQESGETQGKSASQNILENHGEDASHSKDAIHAQIASHPNFETHGKDASHSALGTHETYASHMDPGTHRTYASHTDDENQTKFASRSNIETQEASAGGGGDGQTPSNPLFLNYIILRRLNDIQGDVQEVRIRTASRERGLPKKTEPLASKILEDLEKVKDVEIKEMLFDIPVYHSWLNGVKGIGPRLAGSWISHIALVWKPVEDPTELQKNFEVKTIDKQTRKAVFLYPVYRGIEAFPTISSLWKYCGQDVDEGHAPVRRHGEQFKRNPYMCTLAWKTRKQFILLDESESPYRVLYDGFKKGYAETLGLTAFKEMKDGKETVHYDCVKCVGERRERCRENLSKTAKRLGREVKRFPCRGHVDKLAARRMVKEFIKHLWIEWRRVEGLPIMGTYERDILGHTDG